MDLNRFRNFHFIQLFLCFFINCLLLQAVDIDAVLQSRKCQTNNNIVISFGNHLAVCHFNIAKMLCRKNGTRNHGKRNINFFFLSIDFDRSFFIIGIDEADCYISALSCQVFR